MNTTKFIGSGTYGFIISPHISYNNLYYPYPTIGKIMDHNHEDMDDLFRFSDDEMKASKILKIIDPEQNYFIYGINKNTLKLSKIKQYFDTSKYEFFKNKSNDTIYQQIIMYYAGIPINYYIKNNNITFKKFIDFIRELFLVIKILIDNNLIHQDIKTPNILINDDKLKVIDFSLLNVITEYYSYSNLLFYKKEYIINPCEYRLINTYKIDFNNDISYFIDKEKSLLKSQLKIKDDIFKYIWDDEHHNSLKYMIDSFKQCNNINQRFELLKKWETHKKCDIYSAGLVIIQCLNYFDISNINIKIYDLIHNCLYPCPKDRININDALEFINKIIENKI